MQKSRIPRYLLAIVTGYFLIIVFIENFVISSSFSILSLRTIDDVAFQASLYKYFGMHGTDLLFMNDYGYGWIYWFPIYVITYPANLVFRAFGISWPLIVLPRMQSLAFTAASIVICYKIISKYTKNEWIRAAVVFLMPLFPAGGYLAGRFGTVSQTAFFSMLSMYFVVKSDVLERKSLRYALCAFATAMAVKVSAVCMAPLLCMLILSRYRWKFTKDNIKIWTQEIALAVFVMIFLMSPAIVLWPWNSGNARASLYALMGYWKANQTSEGNFAENFIGALSFTTDIWLMWCMLAALLLLVLAGIMGRKKGHTKYQDYIVIPFGFFAGMFYLSWSVGTGAIDIFKFATAVSFVFPFGLLVLEQFIMPDRKIQKFCIAGCSVILCLMQIGFISEQIRSGDPYNILRYFQESEDHKDKIGKIQEMEMAVDRLCLDQVNLYIDYLAPLTFYCAQEHENLGNTLTIWDDMGSTDYEEANVIVLSKQSTGFLEEQEFLSEIGRLDEAGKAKYKQDRAKRNELVQKQMYLGKNWRLIYEDDESYIFTNTNQK